MDKVFITANELLEDSFSLAVDILATGYKPSYIICVWRGGTPVGVAVQEVFEFFGVATNHFAIRTSSYGGGTTPNKNVKVMGLEYVVETVNAEDQLLIVDDVFDSGRSIDAIIKALHAKCRRNTPSDIRTATVYYKPEKNTTDRVPDYYIHETSAWLVFPHELRGCDMDELRAQKVLPDKAYRLWEELQKGPVS
ncbi:MAG: phosphoribosyltransferase family protein [Pseudomonadota bacterium]